MTVATQNVFIAYHTNHFDEAVTRSRDGSLVVCIDFMLEQQLTEQGVPHLSLKEILSGEGDGEGWWQLAHDVVREWYRVPAMSFFAYENIRLAEAPEPILEAHVARLFYYARIYLALKKKFPNAFFSIAAPQDGHGPECLASFQPWAPVDAARLTGLPFASWALRPAPLPYVFHRHTWKTFALRIYNQLMGLLPPRRFRIYASEYWTHFSPVVPHLDDTELLIAESRKLFSIPWRLLLKHRIRVFRSHDVISKDEERKVRDIAALYLPRWQQAREEARASLERLRADLHWDPVLEAFDYLILYAPRIVADIRTLRRVMERQKPNLVVQMASVGGPEHYFFLMARVAKLLGIPSVELQHAGATIDPRSVYCRIETDYLLTYGPDVNEWHARIGVPKDKLIATGSPRFDRYVTEHEEALHKGRAAYTALRLDPNYPVLVVVVPFSATYVSAVDSYQLAEFYTTIHEIQTQIPGLQILFKVRNNSGVTVLHEYLKKIFTSRYAVSGADDIFPLLCAGDAVLCNNSTVIYQALLAGKPLVLYPWKRFDSYHARVYDRAAPLVYTAPEAVELVTRTLMDRDFSSKLLSRQKQFLQGYLFDGRASFRVAEFLLRLAQKDG